MNCTDELKTTKTTPQALLVLARHIDDLHAAVAKLSTQGDNLQQLMWDQNEHEELLWTKASLPDTAENRGLQNVVDITLDAMAARQQIAALHDQARTAVGEDLEAIQAKIRLLQDGGRYAESVPEGERERVTVTEDQILVELPAPTPERRIARVDFIKSAPGIHTFTPLNQAEFYAAYVKGGPLWLYHGNRDAVMQMPLEWRREMVEDIAQHSPRTAQQVGRDILKVDADTAGERAKTVTDEVRAF